MCLGLNRMRIFFLGGVGRMLEERLEWARQSYFRTVKTASLPGPVFLEAEAGNLSFLLCGNNRSILNFGNAGFHR